MKEDQTKKDQPQEGQSKKDHTREVNLNVSDDTHWAWCPLCNDIWDTKRLLYGFARCLPPDDGECDDPLAKKLPNELCPDHAEETVVDGRRMGMKKALSRKQLDEIRNQYERYCPVCKGRDLEWKVSLHPNFLGINESVLSCRKCHALILLGLLYTRDANDDTWIELMYVLYREDLQTKEQKELDKAWNTIYRITNRQGSKSKIICE